MAPHACGVDVHFGERQTGTRHSVVAGLKAGEQPTVREIKALVSDETQPRPSNRRWRVSLKFQR
ncbi:hypothetical protein MPLB_1510066 [Mesorhizobium sp. ORS 3324]|nr:hypothetical protein MPLB_1510066 [Mesorhizobium sp. ORS 3324]